MKLHTMVREDLVRFPLNAKNASDAVIEMANMVLASGLITTAGPLVTSVLNRELKQTTHVGGNFAFPRGFSRELNRHFLVIGLFGSPVAWDADSDNVRLVVMYVAPLPKDVNYLRILMALADILSRKENRENLMEATDTADLHRRALAVFDVDSGSVFTRRR